MPLPAAPRGMPAAPPPLSSYRGRVPHATAATFPPRGASAWLRLASNKVVLGLLVMVIVAVRVAMPTWPHPGHSDAVQRPPSLPGPHQRSQLLSDATTEAAIQPAHRGILHHGPADAADLSSSLDGDEDSPVVWAFVEQTGTPPTAAAASFVGTADGQYNKHNFSTQLPPGARKFCTASEDPGMEVMEPYVGPRDPEEIANRSVWVDGCSEPVVILPFHGIKMYPGLKCGALREWKRFHATALPRRGIRTVGGEESAVGGAVRVDTTKGVVHIPPRVGVSVEPPADVIKKCLSLCLDSPCCLTFAITRNASTVFDCGLHFCDYTRAHHHREAVEPLNGYSYVLAYRREYRPSLVRSEWRVAVHRAPGRVLRLSGPDQSWTDVMRQATTTAADDGDNIRSSGQTSPAVSAHPHNTVLFDVRTVAEHGTLSQPVHGIVRIRTRCYGALLANQTAPHSSGLQAPLGHGRGEEEVALDVTSPDIRLENGRAVSTGSWLDVATMWRQCVGRWLQFDVSATISRIVPDEALRTPLPDGDNVATLTTTLHSMVHRDAAEARVVFAPPVAAPKSRFGEVTFPQGTFSTSPTRCAPMLSTDECCLNFVLARQFAKGQAAAASRSPLAAASSIRLEHTYVVLNASTHFTPTADTVVNATNLPPSPAPPRSLTCVDLVDGYASHFDEDGVARFSNLVVRVNRQEGRCVEDGVHIKLNGHQRFPLAKEGHQRGGAGNDPWVADEQGVLLPMTWFLGHCGSTGARRRGQPRQLQVARDSLSVVEKKKDDTEEEPILISVPAHECMDCLHSFLQNLRAFVWPSVVVVHFPITTKMPSAKELAGLNRSHPRTFVNTMRIDSVVGVRLLHIHGINIHYALNHLHLPFSHALLLASNEMFVKHGAVAYMRRFDAVWMQTPTADTGALFEHHGDGRHRWTVQEFQPMEEMLRYPPRQWGFVWPDAIVADHWLAAAMRRRNLTGHPMNTVLLEGTFFRRGIAEEFAIEMMTMFDPFDYCEDPMLYPHCEILGPTVLQNVCQRKGIVCGHRVTTMMWLNDGWTSTTDDIRRVRCSPFEVPFGFKRVPRSMTDPVRVEIARLTTQALVSQREVRREVNVTYCRRG